MTFIKTRLEALQQLWKRTATRLNAAHLMMILFVSLNSVGAWLFAPKYGFITCGICSGIYGFLLGRE